MRLSRSSNDRERTRYIATKKRGRGLDSEPVTFTKDRPSVDFDLLVLFVRRASWRGYEPRELFASLARETKGLTTVRQRQRNDRRRIGSKSFSVSRSSFFDQSALYLDIDRCIRPPVRVATSKRTSSRTDGGRLPTVVSTRPEIFQSGTGERPVELRQRLSSGFVVRARSRDRRNVRRAKRKRELSRWRVIPRERVFLLFAAISVYQRAKLHARRSIFTRPLRRTAAERGPISFREFINGWIVRSLGETNSVGITRYAQHDTRYRTVPYDQSGAYRPSVRLRRQTS